MTFRVGQKVVCVDDVYVHPAWKKECKPVAKGIYTIRGIVPGWFENGAAGVRLQEITNPVRLWTTGSRSEVCFWTARFRPAVDRETSIEIFTRLLVPGSKVSEPV